MRREDKSSMSFHPLADLGRNRIRYLGHRCLLVDAVPLFMPLGPFLRPGLQLLQGVARRGCHGGSLRPPAGLGLDGSEHGATLMQVRTPSRASSRIRMHAPCLRTAHAMRTSRFQADKVANEHLYWISRSALSVRGSGSPSGGGWSWRYGETSETSAAFPELRADRP
jgi:hypothetical protein